MTTAPIPQGYPAAQPFTPASYPGLAGKVVLNTGAGSGIGRAMAHAFARHGAKLMLLDIDTVGLEQTRAQLREAFPGVEVHIVQASIADDVAVEQACAATEARFGRIDILLELADDAIALRLCYLQFLSPHIAPARGIFTWPPADARQPISRKSE